MIVFRSMRDLQQADFMNSSCTNSVMHTAVLEGGSLSPEGAGIRQMCSTSSCLFCLWYCCYYTISTFTYIREEWKGKLKCWSASHKPAERKSHPNWLFYPQSSQPTLSESKGVTSGYGVNCTWNQPLFSECKSVTNGYSANCTRNPVYTILLFGVYVWRQKEIVNFKWPLCVLLVCKPNSYKLVYTKWLHDWICLSWLFAFDCAWHY